MQHRISTDDRDFLRSFDGCQVSPQQFDHRAHLRLAYILLAEHDFAHAADRFRDALHAFLRANGIDAAKYHETMTQAWLLAVQLFMKRAGLTVSAEEFLSHSTVLLDPRVMFTHYSRELIGSELARRQFVEPDLDPIPRVH